MNISRITSSLVFLQIISEAIGKRQNYCDYRRNTFYNDVSSDCKKCNPCRIGWGLEDNIEFKIDSLLGATGCRKCRPCAKGTFQNRHNAFRKCKQCKRCSHLGQIEINKCKDRRNTKCDKPKTGVFKLMHNLPGIDRHILNTRSTTSTILVTTSTSRIYSIVQDNDVYNNILLGTVAICTFIVTLVVSVVYIKICIRKHRKRLRDQNLIDNITNLNEKANKDEIRDTKTDSTLILLQKEVKDEII